MKTENRTAEECKVDGTKVCPQSNCHCKLNKPLKEHFEHETDAGTTLATFDYIKALEEYIERIEADSESESTITQLREENERLKVRDNNYLFLQRDKDATIKELVEVLKFCQNKAYIIVNTKGGITRSDIRVDAVKLKDKLESTLSKVKL